MEIKDLLPNVAETVQDFYPSLKFAFIDSSRHMHTNPACEHVSGEIEMLPLESKFRGNFICECLEVILSPDSGPTRTVVSEGMNTDAPENGTATPGSGEPIKREWPSDLPTSEHSLTDPIVCAEWLARCERKLEPSDIEAIPGLKKAASDYALNTENHYMKDGKLNTFIESVANQIARYDIKAGQAKGVLNWWRAQVMYAAKNEPIDNSPVAKDSGLDLSGIPKGMYAVPGGDTRLKVMIESVKADSTSKWAGCTFVHDGAAYGSRKKYGMQRAGQNYKGDIIEALTIIAADPIEAMKAYGRLVGKCGKCGRKLEDADSVAAGIGPWCAAKMRS